MNKILSKFTSRKFIICISGVLTGIILMISGDVTEGATTMVTSIISYITMEGIIDTASIKNAVSVINTISDDLEGQIEEIK